MMGGGSWARAVAGDPGMVARLRRVERAPADLLVTCPPQVLEFCHSARTPKDHESYREQIALGFPLEHAPDESLVIDIQSALWSAGLARTAGPLDILIAAYAIRNDATVLAADRNFDHVAQVSDLQHEYIAPEAAENR